MDSEAKEQKRFRSFLKERSRILEDIKQFLFVVLSYCLDMEYNWHYRRDFVSTKISNNLHSLIESLCLIHGLYGYPELSKKCNNAAVNKRAVRDILLNEIKQENKEKKMITLVDYCKEATEDEFWKFRFSNGTSSLESSFREPAHIFLQMVQDVFDNHKEASVIGRNFLESLYDENYLKPVVWAEHKSKPECCGVSLGVRSFVRPLYLYIKLDRLRNVENEHNGVKLQDVNAFKSMDRKLLSKLKQSKYTKNKEPCGSCQVFFAGLDNECEKRSFPPFGNCAEYDVIRTANLDSLLSYIEKDTAHWKTFKSACQKHFEAFNAMLTEMLRVPGSGNPSRNEIMQTYYAKTARNAQQKVLVYEWKSESNSYELVAKNWPCKR